MTDTILVGEGSDFREIPLSDWQDEIAASAIEIADELSFMTEDHHAVRYFVVWSLPIMGIPIAPDVIAESLNLPLDRVQFILDDLEKHLTFLYRNSQGDVTWAYPVTTDKTPHHMAFSSGENIYSA